MLFYLHSESMQPLSTPVIKPSLYHPSSLLFSHFFQNAPFRFRLLICFLKTQFPRNYIPFFRFLQSLFFRRSNVSISPHMNPKTPVRHTLGVLSRFHGDHLMFITVSPAPPSRCAHRHRWASEDLLLVKALLSPPWDHPARRNA